MSVGDERGAAIPGEWLAAGIGASVLVLAVLMHQAGLAIDPSAASNLPYDACGALAVGLCVGLRRRATRVQQVVRDTAEYYALFTLIGLVGAVASYPDAATSHGFVDATLARADAAVGFDWVGWYRVVAEHPVLQVAGRLAYESIYWTPVAILGAFAWTGRQDRARACLASFWVAALLTLALFRLMPAVGPLAYLWHGPVPYMPASALWQPVLIPPLRQHLVHTVDLGQLRGLVSAPSFHTAAAVLYIVAAWPMRRLRWPVLGINAAMLLSTPVEGTHYLTDMLAGAAVAGVALSAVGWAMSHRARVSAMDAQVALTG
jgi:hypothetical protein